MFLVCCFNDDPFREPLISRQPSRFVCAENMQTKMNIIRIVYVCVCVLDLTSELCM